ncbi:MAG: DUF1385 domain-containing protein [Clostridiales bacterium]|nr:DUF1385 domain-containing protein [Clostridiales bacterium]
MSINENSKTKRPDIGGQAVLEGVMMKAPDHIAVAVRRPNGDIVVKRDAYSSPAKKHKWMGLPFIRGAVNMGLMMQLGMNVLTASGEMSGIMDEEPSRFEKWLAKKLGKGVDKVVMGVAIVLALVLSTGLFVLLPNLPAKALRGAGWSLLSVNLISGLIRIFILIGYLMFCGLIPDMRKTFQYHGAEHKTVYAHEAQVELTPQNAQTYSRLHPRCGTSFLLITFVFSILFFSSMDQVILSLSGYDMASNYLLRISSRLLMLPLVAGISYEILKSLAHADSKFARALRWPGLQLQRLTTKEPTLEMLEVAIASMQSALGDLPQGEKTQEGYALIKKVQTAPAA